ncbi:DUF2500 domain-containing protein [Alicyclobacillus dauci]|uniref:DUF2500 domain-containing protein n=1 Tax=Alicyclobacillus dauci TaxID=1475485 RepID=A0ABY6ZA98_9BACL|nr:DUF2500 domain-containing protein [Alicyclobacillus dauci]
MAIYHLYLCFERIVLCVIVKIVLTVPAKLVAKRTAVHRHAQNVNGVPQQSSSTSYYVTFEFESRDRMEFKVHGNDYGLLAEGDSGKLTFQGTQFKGFDRTR